MMETASKAKLTMPKKRLDISLKMPSKTWFLVFFNTTDGCSLTELMREVLEVKKSSKLPGKGRGNVTEESSLPLTTNSWEEHIGSCSHPGPI